MAKYKKKSRGRSRSRQPRRVTVGRLLDLLEEKNEFKRANRGKKASMVNRALAVAGVYLTEYARSQLYTMTPYEMIQYAKRMGNEFKKHYDEYSPAVYRHGKMIMGYSNQHHLEPVQKPRDQGPGLGWFYNDRRYENQLEIHHSRPHNDRQVAIYTPRFAKFGGKPSTFAANRFQVDYTYHKSKRYKKKNYRKRYYRKR